MACVVSMYYSRDVWEDLDWSKRGEYIAKHGVTPEEANDALTDENRVVLDPDYASVSGLSVRVIGYSELAGKLLTVIALRDEGVEYGVNAWEVDKRDQRIYDTKGESNE